LESSDKSCSGAKQPPGDGGSRQSPRPRRSRRRRRPDHDVRRFRWQPPVHFTKVANASANRQH
jgi:hypothetical protein